MCFVDGPWHSPAFPTEDRSRASLFGVGTTARWIGQGLFWPTEKFWPLGSQLSGTRPQVPGENTAGEDFGASMVLSEDGNVFTIGSP
jgi:hypothetical protein